MKKIFAIVLLSALVVGVAFAQTYRRGNHDGTGTGYHGPLTVRVAIDGNNRITGITIRNHRDTDGFVNMVVQQLIPRIIQAQSPDVDGVTGATATANGVKEAVRNALNSARQ